MANCFLVCVSCSFVVGDGDVTSQVGSTICLLAMAFGKFV